MTGSNTGTTTEIRRRVVGTSAAMSDSGVGTSSSECSKSYTDADVEQLLKACEEGRLVDVRELVAGKKELKNCVANNPQGDTPLHIAVNFGHMDIVQYLVEEGGCKVDSRNRYKNTPLYHAAKQGKLEVVKYFIGERGSDPMIYCRWQRTPLHIACKHGQLAVVKYLMDTSGVDVDSSVKDTLLQTPLQLAAEYGTMEVVEYMMEHERQTNGLEQDQTKGLEQEPYSLLHFAAYGGKLETVEYLIQKRGYHPMIRDSKNRTPLHSACKKGNLNVVKYLVENCEIDISCRNNTSHVTPLDMAAEKGHMQVVQYLVEERKCPVSPGSKNAHSALHRAAYGGKLDIVKYFITEAKCDPSCRGWKGRTPLHSACTNGKYDVMSYLIEQHKVDSSVEDDVGTTPLHLAAKQGRLPVIKQLVNKFKCNVDVKDHLGKTPLDYANERKHNTVSKYLLKVKEIVSGKYIAQLKKHFNNLLYNYTDEHHKKLEEKLTPYIVSCTPTGKKLGKGAYSTVIELSLNDNESVCLAGKVFKTNKSPKMMQGKFEMELELMVGLKHENIVQCEGVCFLPSSMLPVLVMEKMEINLHDYLLKPDDSILPLERKVSFLLDTARGLDYLHSHKPAIIHRDLTAKNVLLDSQLQKAKISDFGNSQLKNDCSWTKGTLTTLPGTQEYMPPEATVEHGRSLDVFSFGHLSLLVLIQTQLRPLLPPSYVDPTSKLNCVRTEVERREKFFRKAQEKLSSDSHPLLELIEKCLHNESSQRPQTKKILHEMQTLCMLSICINFLSSLFHCAGGVNSTGNIQEAMDIIKPELDNICADATPKIGNYRYICWGPIVNLDRLKAVRRL